MTLPLGAAGLKRMIAICLCFALHAQLARAEVRFTFSLDRPAPTSAGLYDPDGRLVRVLWTMKDLGAGPQQGGWDGLDQFGRGAPAGKYAFRVVANRAAYANVGAIGNSGQSPNDRGHTPTNIEAVAVDQDGNVYTANGWDEAGADFKKWDADGKSVYDAQFQIRNGRPNGAPYAIAVDEEYLYCAVGGWEREPWNNRQQIQRFRLADGKHVPFSGKSEKSSTEPDKSGDRAVRVAKGPADVLLDGHIQVYEWPGLMVPKNASAADAELMRAPLRALAIYGDTLYVADALGGRVRMYDKESGAAKGEFAVQLPTAVDVDPTGQIWVAHERTNVSAFRPDGYRGVGYGGLGDVTSLTFGPGATLYVTDAAAGKVMRLDTTATPPGFVPVLGAKAAPGDRAADRFYKLRGVAVDAKGNLITIQREPGRGGARLAKWSAERKLVWEHFGTEFVSLGNYGVSDPDTLYTISNHRHRLLDRAKGTWEYLGNTYDPAADYDSDPHGVVRVLRIDGRDFVFTPMGDGVQVYRVDGPVLRLAALVGGNDPDPRGEHRKAKVSKWAWSDAGGAGKPDPRTIRPVDDHYTCFGMDVDARAAIWFANTHTHSIWTLPLAGLDARGNPAYDWRLAREVVPPDGSEVAFDPAMVQAAADGSFYAFGWSKTYPRPKDSPFWMGGNTLCRFDAQGKRLWTIELPETVVGMDTIPPAKAGDVSPGLILGGGKSAHLYHYTSDGLLIGTLRPGDAMGKQSGWLDNHASVAVNRDPRDGLVDVFTEDDFACRIGWYRIDDRPTQTINGELNKP